MGGYRDWLGCIFGIIVGLPVLLATNIISLALTLALFPILVPIYMVKGSVLFTADFFDGKGARHFLEEPLSTLFYSAIGYSILFGSYRNHCTIIVRFRHIPKMNNQLLAQ